MRIIHLHIHLKEINLIFECLASVPLSLPLSILLFLFSPPSFVFIFPPPGCCVSIRTTGAIGGRGHLPLQPGPKEGYPPVHTILIGLNFVNIYRYTFYVGVKYIARHLTCAQGFGPKEVSPMRMCWSPLS